eukprot:3792524-Ditylum_brightwellii.AAC.2
MSKPCRGSGRVTNFSDQESKPSASFAVRRVELVVDSIALERGDVHSKGVVDEVGVALAMTSAIRQNGVRWRM